MISPRRMKKIKNKLNNFIIWERPCYPGLVYKAGEAVVIPHKKEFGRPWAKTYAFFNKGMVKYVWPKKEFLDNSKYIAETFLDTKYFNLKKRKLNSLTQKLVKGKNKLLKANFNKLSNQEFIKVNNGFQKTYLNWWAWAQVAEPAAAGLELFLRKDLDLTPEEFNVLTSSTKKSYTMEEEEDIFSLALDYKKNKKISPTNLKKHVEQYFWINNGYDHTYYLDSEYFKQKIKEVATKLSEKKIKTSLLNNHKRLILASINKNNLEKKLKIAKKTLKIIEIIDWLGDFQDKRKALSLETNYYLDEIVRELARRSKLPYNLARYLIPNEYSDAIKGKFSLAVLKERRRFMEIIYTEKGAKIYFDDTAREDEFKLLGKVSDTDLNEIQGTRAMGGKIIGRANVILKKADLNKMKEREILVTTMTSPDFIAAMKKAAAIVTDEGGITCHAAIISRELGIPCVIGTKIATRVIKDGDILEVNANHGLIKKL